MKKMFLILSVIILTSVNAKAEIIWPWTDNIEANYIKAERLEEDALDRIENAKEDYEDAKISGSSYDEKVARQELIEAKRDYGDVANYLVRAKQQLARQNRQEQREEISSQSSAVVYQKNLAEQRLRDSVDSVHKTASEKLNEIFN
jgi:uncharacterized protein (UPF0335 family)